MNRRDFLKSTAAAALLSGAPLKAAPKLAATDWVTLGDSGVKVTRLAFGTRSNGGRIQRELGREGFNRLVRQALNTEYVDILLPHCVRTKGWTEDFKFMRDEYDNAKSKKAILSHRVSCHGLLPLSDFPGQKWLDVALLRVNHNSERMDNLQSEASERGDVARVTSQISKIHGTVNAVTIGYKSAAEIDEAIENISFVSTT